MDDKEIKEVANKIKKTFLKRMEKYAIQNLGSENKQTIDQWVKQQQETEQEKIKSIISAAEKFKQSMGNAAKGKWADAAKKSINDQIQSLESLK